MHLRRATSRDIPEIVRTKGELMTSSYPFEVDLSKHPDWPDRAAARLEEMLARPGYTFYVIDDPETEGRLIGVISLSVQLAVPGPEWPGIMAYLGDMYVDPAYRGRSLGTLLMRQALDDAKAAGARNVKLYATPDAVGIYEHLGFHRAVPKEPELFPEMWLDFD